MLNTPRPANPYPTLRIRVLAKTLLAFLRSIALLYATRTTRATKFDAVASGLVVEEDNAVLRPVGALPGLYAATTISTSKSSEAAR
mgnify:CR=1 FL=1